MASATSVGVVTRTASGSRVAGAANTASSVTAACVIAGVTIRIVAGPIVNPRIASYRYFTDSTITTSRQFFYLVFSDHVVVAEGMHWKVSLVIRESIFIHGVVVAGYTSIFPWCDTMICIRTGITSCKGSRWRMVTSTGA